MIVLGFKISLIPSIKPSEECTDIPLNACNFKSAVETINKCKQETNPIYLSIGDTNKYWWLVDIKKDCDRESIARALRKLLKKRKCGKDYNKLVDTWYTRYLGEIREG